MSATSFLVAAVRYRIGVWREGSLGQSVRAVERETWELKEQLMASLPARHGSN
jgi:hypothetical protein